MPILKYSSLSQKQSNAYFPNLVHTSIGGILYMPQGEKLFKLEYEQRPHSRSTKTAQNQKLETRVSNLFFSHVKRGLILTKMMSIFQKSHFNAK